MPEGSKDASILIATSWQALSRAFQNAMNDNGDALICDCTIIILFAGYFIESNLNNIIEKLNKTEDMKKYLGIKKHKYPGMLGKFAWFYNQYVARAKASNKEQMYKNGVKGKLGRRFPGFNKIYNFRNDISHGRINRSVANLQDAIILRQQAADIVKELFRITEKAGHIIPRDIDYWTAISS